MLFVDETGPEITLNGDDPTLVEQGRDYTELGATALDAFDGDILAVDITIGGDTVDTSKVGDYDLTYDVSDTATNAATTVFRTVTVTPGKYKNTYLCVN